MTQETTKEMLERLAQAAAPTPHVFVATTETAGNLITSPRARTAIHGRANDFSHAQEGDLLLFSALECDGEKVDGHCGCKRSLMGLNGGATTTMKVAPYAGSAISLADVILESLRDNGWLTTMPAEKARKIAEDDARQMLRVAAAFPVGMIVERRGNTFRERCVSIFPSPPTVPASPAFTKRADRKPKEQIESE